MANTPRLKRSDVPDKIPLTTDLDFGELGYNSWDGKLYAKRYVEGPPLGEEIVIIGDPDGKLVDSYTSNIGAQIGTTTIPFDDTPPLITEGTDIVDGNVTLIHDYDTVSIAGTIVVENSSKNKTIIIAIFRDSVCIAAIPIGIAVADIPYPLSWHVSDAPAVAGTINYSMRIGTTGGTWTVNSPSDGHLGNLVEDGSTFTVQARS